jgi:hypothetical protein
VPIKRRVPSLTRASPLQSSNDAALTRASLVPVAFDFRAGAFYACIFDLICFSVCLLARVLSQFVVRKKWKRFAPRYGDKPLDGFLFALGIHAEGDS